MKKLKNKVFKISSVEKEDETNTHTTSTASKKATYIEQKSSKGGLSQSGAPHNLYVQNTTWQKEDKQK